MHMATSFSDCLRSILRVTIRYNSLLQFAYLAKLRLVVLQNESVYDAFEKAYGSFPLRGAIII